MQLKHVAVVLTSGLVFAGCSLLPAQTEELQESDKMMEETSEEMMVEEESMMEETETMEDVDAMMESTHTKLVATNFSFGTDEIRVKQGESLKVSVMNKEGVHDFVIDELDISSGIIPEGETMEIEIPTDQPGTYEYYCSVGQHRANGMFGTIIIE